MVTRQGTLDAATLRRLAVRASVDPKSIRKVFEGKPVRGLAGHRAATVLREAGLLASEAAANLTAFQRAPTPSAEERGA